MKLYKIGALVAVTTIAMVFFGSVAQASNPAGYILVASAPFTAPAFSQTHGFATCPGARQPSGGGIFNESGGSPSALNSSYPSGKTWQVDVNNPTSTSGGFIVYVVCLHNNAKYTIASAAGTAVNGVQSSLSAKCPAHTTVVGGGAFSSSSSTAVNLNSLLPVTHGWRADINNTTGSNSSFSVYAVCRAKPTGYVVETSGSISNPAGAQTTATTNCPFGGGSVAISGGALSASINTSVQMNSSFPNGSGGWTVFEQNLSSAATTVTGYAICAGT
jgi:hypothetical protein